MSKRHSPQRRSRGYSRRDVDTREPIQRFLIVCEGEKTEPIAYVKRLSECLGHSYRKNSEGIYDELRDRQEQAIANAKRLLAQYAPPNPAQDNPSTTVHKLVEELNRFIR